MKKLGALLIIGTLLLTGCGNKVVCSSTIKNDDSSAKVKIIANMKSGKVSSLSAEMNFDTEKGANIACSSIAIISGYSNSEDGKKIDYKCKDKKITIKNYDLLLNSEDDKFVGLSKDEFINRMTKENNDDRKVTCK